MRALTGGRIALAGMLAVGLAAAADASATGRDVLDEPRLAGLMECTPAVEARWPWSGAWVFPVGDSLDLERPLGHVRGYYISRGVIPHSSSHSGHDGADLVNGSRGGRVRAAASGVAVSVKRASLGGYGAHVVIAHHLDDGSIVYTVYAHLASKSLRIRKGAVVSAGDPIARVGQTGRATTPHLHFEVRVPEDSTLRWENCPVADPIAFIRDRLPTERPDSDWASPYLAWAEFAGLVPLGVDADAPVDAALLERVLERAGASDEETVSLAESKSSRSGPERWGWDAIARGLASVSTGPSRLRPCRIGLRRYARTCHEHLGVRRPSLELHRLGDRDARPTVAELCLALADFAPRPQPRKAAPKPDHLTAVP